MGRRGDADETEFGGVSGLIEEQRREERLLEPHEELLEIYATNPADPKSTPETAKIERP